MTATSTRALDDATRPRDLSSTVVVTRISSTLTHDVAPVRSAPSAAEASPTDPRKPHIPRKPVKPHAPHTTRDPAALARIAGLDGLRALAVTAVVAYHAGATWLPGGFLGVDVFFVLSGFLITTLILHEVAGTGRLDVRTFYRRRVRRLVPALWVMLAVVSLVGIIMRDQLASLRWHVLAGATYVSNWWQLLADDSYFESSGRPPLLRHLWSLAIEGQFYLLAPAIAWIAFRWGKRRLAWIALVLAGLSTATMAWLAITREMPIPNDPSRLYFGTDTHASGLLIGVVLGALLAAGPLVRRWWTPAVADLVGVGSLVALAVVMTQVGEFSGALYRGGFLLVAVLSAIAIAVCLHPGALVGRALDWAPLVWLGTRSYGIYLWHWPVFMLTRPGIDLPWTGWAVQTARIAFVLMLAEASYRLVERPIRRGALVRLAATMRAGGRPGRTATRAVRVGAAACIALIAALLVVPPSRSDAEQAADAVMNSTSSLSGAAATPSAGPRQGIGLGENQAPSARLASLDAPTTKSGLVRASKSVLVDPGAVPSTGAITDGSQDAAGVAVAVAPAPPNPAEIIGTMTAVGDSVLAMAAPDLIAKGMAVDAVKSRQFREMVDIVVAQRDAGTLGNTVVIQGGTNGPIAESDLRRLLDATADRRVYVLTMRAPVTWEGLNNELLPRIAAEYPQVQVIDWHTISGQHPEWLYSDGIHPREGEGTAGLTEAIWAAIQPA